MAISDPVLAATPILNLVAVSAHAVSAVEARQQRVKLNDTVVRAALLAITRHKTLCEAAIAYNGVLATLVCEQATPDITACIKVENMHEWKALLKMLKDEAFPGNNEEWAGWASELIGKKRNAPSVHT